MYKSKISTKNTCIVNILPHLLYHLAGSIVCACICDFFFLNDLKVT